MTPLDLRAVEARLNDRYAEMQELRADGNALLDHCRTLRTELRFRAGPVSGDLALIAAAANDGLVCEPTLGIDNMRWQLEAIREAGRVGTEHAAAVLAQAMDGEAP